MRSAILALALLGAAGTADAAKVIVTHSGHVPVGGGTDYYGLFTAPGTNLSGAAYTIAFTMDLSHTTSGVYTAPDGTQVIGYSYGPESISVTVAGTTRTYADPQGGEMDRSWYAPGTNVRQYLVTDTFDDSFSGGDTLIFVQLASNDPMFSSFDITSPFSYTAAPGDSAYGSFYYHGHNFGLFDEHVSSTGLVPEPASWSMMLGGFGLIGGALRGHRRRASTARA